MGVHIRSAVILKLKERVESIRGVSIVKAQELFLIS
jgi:hypothetical protein